MVPGTRMIKRFRSCGVRCVGGSRRQADVKRCDIARACSPHLVQNLPNNSRDSWMDRGRISSIASEWMIPTSKTAYMAGLETKPVIAAARGVWVIDTEGKEYLDFGSGQMAAALGHNHPRYVAAVERNLKTIRPPAKTLLNVDPPGMHQRPGQIPGPPPP